MTTECQGSKQTVMQQTPVPMSSPLNYMLHMHVLVPHWLSISCSVASVGTILTAAIIVLRWNAVAVTILCRCAVAIIVLIVKTFLLHRKIRSSLQQSVSCVGDLKGRKR